MDNGFSPSVHAGSFIQYIHLFVLLLQLLLRASQIFFVANMIHTNVL